MPTLKQTDSCATAAPANPVVNGLSVDVIGSFDSVPMTAAEWDGFMESMGAEIFLSYDWCRLWWKYYGANGSLQIFVFRSQEALVGIVPLYIESIACGGRVARILCSHFMPTTVRLTIERSHLAAAMEVIPRRLFGENAVDMIHLGPLAGGYGDFDQLFEACQKSGGETFQAESFCNDVQTYFPLKDTWDEQMNQLSRQERKRMRRVYKDMESAGMALTVTCADRETFPDIFSKFVAMHQQKWEQSGSAGHFVDWPRARQFHEENAAVQLQQGRLRLLELKINGQAIGYKFAFRFGNGMCAFLDARSEIPGSVRIQFSHLAFSEQMQRAIGEGIKWVDSMRGRYPHKLALGGVIAPIHSIVLCRKGGLSTAKAKLFQKLAFLFDGFYYKLFRCRLVPRLHLKVKEHQSWWLRTHTLVPSRRQPEPGPETAAETAPEN